MREPKPFALDTLTVMQNANRLHLREHRELLSAHNVNLCEGEDSWLDEEPDEGLTVLGEVEFFQAFFLDGTE